MEFYLGMAENVVNLCLSDFCCFAVFSQKTPPLIFAIEYFLFTFAVGIIVDNMNFDIVEIEDYSGKMAHIYSLVMENEEESLLEQFFAENAEYKQEINEIDELLYGMGHILGCQRNLFKHNEGALGDGVAAVRVGRLRLYCLYFDNTAVFFGSGGYKPPEIHAYQEDKKLNAKAQQMREIARKLNKAIQNKDITIEDDGSLTINNFDYD